MLPASPLGKGIGYTQRQWTALCTYESDGRLEIDNNAAERAWRRIAVGCKNWLFFQREGGGRTAAILLSTAQAAEVDPATYFRDVLVRSSRKRDFAMLLPYAWNEHFAGNVEHWRSETIAWIGGR